MSTLIAPARPPVRLPEHLPVAVTALVLLVLSVEAGVSAGQEGFGAPTLLRLGIIAGGLLAAVWLARFEYFLLVVLVLRPLLDIAKVGGGPPVLASGLAALVVLGVTLWLAAQAYAGTLRPVSLLGRLAVLLLLVMTVSAVAASDPLRSILQVARLAAAVGVFLAVEQLLVEPARRRQVLVACFLSSIVPMLVGVYQVFAGSYLRSANGLGRVTGTFVHPNAFGFYLVLLLVMGAAVYRYLEGWPRLLTAVVLAGGTGSLLLTYSRGSWVAIVAGLLVVGALQARKLLVLLPVGLLLVPVVAPSVLDRLSDLSQSQTVNGTPGNSFFWRLDHWGVVLRGARGHELIGIGPGSSDFLGDTVLPPHNDFVRMYVETGFLGTCVYVALLVAAVLTCRRALRAAPGRSLERGIAVGALACTVAFLVGSVGGNLISQVVVLLYLFTFLAAASAVAGQGTGAAWRRLLAPPPAPPTGAPTGARSSAAPTGSTRVTAGSR